MPLLRLPLCAWAELCMVYLQCRWSGRDVAEDPIAAIATWRGSPGTLPYYLPDIQRPSIAICRFFPFSALFIVYLHRWFSLGDTRDDRDGRWTPFLCGALFAALHRLLVLTFSPFLAFPSTLYYPLALLSILYTFLTCGTCAVCLTGWLFGTLGSYWHIRTSLRASRTPTHSSATNGTRRRRRIAGYACTFCHYLLLLHPASVTCRGISRTAPAVAPARCRVLYPTPPASLLPTPSANNILLLHRRLARCHSARAFRHCASPEDDAVLLWRLPDDILYLTVRRFRRGRNAVDVLVMRCTLFTVLWFLPWRAVSLRVGCWPPRDTTCLFPASTARRLLTPAGVAHFFCFSHVLPVVAHLQQPLLPPLRHGRVVPFRRTICYRAAGCTLPLTQHRQCCVDGRGTRFRAAAARAHTALHSRALLRARAP